MELMKNTSRAFTVIEIIFVAVIAGIASIFFFIQKNNIETINRDSSKKIAINAMYYSLEEVFYAKNGYYPQMISSDILKSVDPNLFTDPAGHQINTTNSAYTYTPLNCNDNKCKSYELKTTLDNEADYIKKSKN